MSDIDQYAIGFVELCAYEGEEGVAVCTLGGKILVRFDDAKGAERLLRRVMAEWDKPEGTTLQ